MAIESKSNPSNPNNTSDVELQPDDFDGASDSISPEALANQKVLELAAQQSKATTEKSRTINTQSAVYSIAVKPRVLLLLAICIGIALIGLGLNLWILGLVGGFISLVLSIAILYPWLVAIIDEWFLPQERTIVLAFAGTITAIISLVRFTGISSNLMEWGRKVNWDASGTLAEWFGALGQILIAIIAVYVAWRQYVISKDLTIQQNALTVQQNIITQQQTIDSYFQGVSDLVLDEEGLLEDWPQERAIAEGRTAAIFSSVDGSGKAKILRFLSRSKLLSPLKRDGHLGRPILDGSGGYAEDRLAGVRVIDLGVMLAASDLSNTDLRWTDLSEANLVRANLNNADLVKANLSRTILYQANLKEADLSGVRFFYGEAGTASPRSRNEAPNYEIGDKTGAVVEDVDFTGVKRISDSARHYCCSWCGEKSRATIPGGCEGIPNKLGR
jgi:uncharacterized protein YjbI with pentapeptide repeats